MEYELGIISSDFIGLPLIKPDDYESKKLYEATNSLGVCTLFIDPTMIIVTLNDNSVEVKYVLKSNDGEEQLIVGVKSFVG